MNDKYKKLMKLKAGASLLKIVFTLIGLVLLVLLIIYGLPIATKAFIENITSSI